ncbi:hypothetical protein ANANG_G00171380 [Anguilla anguilla]|uniref:Amphiphysin n=1 Tax=Anguilla anguilla TaxID=7936 RepID=A0A9D3M3I4_ANGAN|nr:hypothetical protein ANANG_G00171380 [Anguilla anguilla]
MAEIKTGIFAKNVQKRLNRAQEKVLQKLGKADETKDEQFEQCVQNFKRQESEGSRLQREMKAYLAAVKGMQQASMNLTESLHEVYEPDWYGKDDVMTVGKSCDALWEDFHQKLVDSSLITLDTYLSQFPDIKTRVSKRSRKLIDYDSARHHLETLQASTIRNDRKLSKAEEELKKAQKVFDDFNVDLQQELPTLWDSRVGFYVSTFKNVTHLEAKFHREISVLCHKLYEVMNKLAEQHSDKMFTIQGAPSDSGPLRFARTPTPPDESPPESPEDSPNHTLAPGPHRPKSPSLLKKGPPVPPPKITPTTELHQEQIISLFDNNFAPTRLRAPPPPHRLAIDSLLDMDFDPFKPDSAAPIGQSQSPMSQTLPWDLWTAPAAEAVQPGASDWAADFSGLGAGQEAAAAAADGGENGAARAAEAQDWPPAEGWGTEAAAGRRWRRPQRLRPSRPRPEAETAETKMTEAETAETETKMADAETAEIETAAEDASVEVEAAKAEDVTEGSELGLYAAQGAADGSKLDWGLSGQAGSDWSGSEYETADEWAESTQEDLFQKQAGEENLGPANETRFQASEPAVPSTVPGPAEQSSADPFEADPQADPFSQAGGAELVLDFVSDPFAGAPGGRRGLGLRPLRQRRRPDVARELGPGGGRGDLGLPQRLGRAAQRLCAVGGVSRPPCQQRGRSRRQRQPLAGGERRRRLLLQQRPGRVYRQLGRRRPGTLRCPFPWPGRGEKEAGGPAKGRPVAQLDAQGSWINATEAAPGHRDTESSDLSEDEITNRRLGKLYQDVDTEKEEVSNNALNGVTQPEAGAAAVSADSNQGALEATSEPEAAAPEAETEAAPEPVSETGEAQEPPAAAEASETSPTAEKPADTTEAEVAEPVVSPEAESPEITPPTDAEKQPCDEAALETATTEEVEVGSPTAEAPAPAEDKESPKEQTLTVEPEGGEESKQEGAEETEAKEEKMPIPSVVIEPASSNEGDDDRDGDITSPTVSTGNGVTPESQPGPPGMPPGFLYKVEALHDFEAANSDELELKKGDVVLVLPTENMEDQDAGWLTGIKESDWLQQGGTAPKGLFPENFVQRSE